MTFADAAGRLLSCVAGGGRVCAALMNKAGSPLYRHELGYVLGQMQLQSAVPTLTTVLSDTTDAIIVRHECAEALGALANPASIAVLEAMLSDPNPEIVETCDVALALIRWSATATAEERAGLDENPFLSHDPAPADVKSKTVAQLREQLLDASLPMFDRYRAMFSLRNRGTPKCIQVPSASASTFAFASAFASACPRSCSPRCVCSCVCVACVVHGEHTRGCCVFHVRAVACVRLFTASLCCTVLQQALSEGLKDASALFRHEVAYVFGQMQSPLTIEVLTQVTHVAA